MPACIILLNQSLQVNHVVDWLDAASTIKDLKLAPLAKRKWARVLAGPVGEILSNITDNLGRDLLRKSRIRLDVACMLVFRSCFASLPMKDVSINIWIDASRQWRSRELLASSFDLVVAQGDGAPKFGRRLFPMLRVGIVSRIAIGKCAALLWQIWLLVGPVFAHSRAFLQNVVSITTEQGTERLLADLLDLLPAFYKYIGAALPKEVEFGERLFPHCLGSPGWNHICDGLVQTRLNSLR